MRQVPEVVELDEQPTAVIRLTVPRSEMRSVMGPGVGELFSTCAAQGIAPTGPWFTHHFRMDPEVFDFEIGVPVAQAVVPTRRVVGGRLPAARVARAVYSGPYEGLAEAWGSLDRWIREQGHTAQGMLWEVYAVGPESGTDTSKWQTVLHRPLVKA
jgi:effector-binding domain-containing protein